MSHLADWGAFQSNSAPDEISTDSHVGEETMILKDRVAIVTAAGSGIGRAGAEIMGREGAIVIATDLVAERAAETARRIRDAGGRAEARALDVTQDADIEGTIEHAARTY